MKVLVVGREGERERGRAEEIWQRRKVANVISKFALPRVKFASSRGHCSHPRTSLLLLLLPSQQMIHDRYELHPRCVLSGIKTRQRKGQPQSVGRPLLHFKTIMTSIKRRKKQSPLRRDRERGRPDYISRNSRDSNLVPINTLEETLLQPAWYLLDLGIGLSTRVRACHTSALLVLRKRCLPRPWVVGPWPPYSHREIRQC